MSQTLLAFSGCIEKNIQLVKSVLDMQEPKESTMFFLQHLYMRVFVILAGEGLRSKEWRRWHDGDGGGEAEDAGTCHEKRKTLFFKSYFALCLFFFQLLSAAAVTLSFWFNIFFNFTFANFAFNNLLEVLFVCNSYLVVTAGLSFPPFSHVTGGSQSWQAGQSGGVPQINRQKRV